ncbi:hypothetical protein [Pseudoclavibacter sp. VKM Ac-2867]|uniref:hypothetical protein n=1 Tax=Pseudoclavibacter sp. VKM Ac-2867 TaxID=2783829 RepID=UPI001E5B3917|nr:hypothetical protein [Pseudoclavibacter sp. VKM Ac-2867]
MMSDAGRLIESSQEQAVAAWASHLNQLRVDTLLAALGQQDLNLREALSSIDAAIAKIDLEVIATNRGGVKGMHGFIAEVAEVGIGNARSLIVGTDAAYQWVNDNGPVDLLRDGIDIQQKFVAAGGRLGLGAIADHLEKYPDFLKNGAKYQIPADHFERIQALHAMSPEEAGKLVRGPGDGPSFREWQRVQAFFSQNSVDIDVLEPSKLEYHQAQRGAYESTLSAEKESLRSTDGTQRADAVQASGTSLQEGMKVTLAAAAIEGGATFVLAVVEKRRGGTQLRDFTSENWIEIAGDSGLGFAKGGVRGLTIYSLTNFTKTSAAVASSVVTAGFAIAEQANRLRAGEISETEFIGNAELVCLESAVSALSSFVGQALIPAPVLGAVIGNAVGIIMYKAVRDSLANREAALIGRYLREQQVLAEHLASEYEDLIRRLDESLAGYLDLLDHALSPDIATALLGSVELALEVGVAPEEVLDSDAKTLAYFLD